MLPDCGLCRYVRLPRLMATVFLAVVTGVLVAQQFLECAFAGPFSVVVGEVDGVI